MVKTLFDHMKGLGYGNIQVAVNTGPGGTINPEMLKLVTDYQETEGWFEIAIDEIILINPGDRVRYTTNDNPPDPNSPERLVENDKYPTIFAEAPRRKFRTGGWCISVHPGERYILYKPHVVGSCPQSIQYDYIDRLFYLPKGGEASKGRKPVKYKHPTNVTPYPVCMLDENGESVTVYYGRDSYAQRHFMETEKYKSALKYGWSFKM
jgi:hypothetical protein